MDGPISDLVRRYKLTTRYERAFTIHFHSDPDVHPSAPCRQERWKKLRTLGHGAQGDVILETCTDGSRGFTERAVKRIRLESEHSKRYYRRELECIVTFSHEKYSQYFVKFFGWYTTSNKLHLAMEFLPYGDLYAYVSDHQSLTDEECSNITSQVLSGVAIVHEKGFAHRDVKPHNILIYKAPVNLDPSSWWVKLADFGISKNLTTETTGTTLAPGTPLFMAPELLHPDSQSVSTRDYQMGDMWAIGITTFFLLTKTLPFKSQLAVLNYKGSSDEASGTLVHCQVTGKAQDFVSRLLNPRPGERLGAAEAREHDWTCAWLPELPTSRTHSRPSTVSSRRSSLQDCTGTPREISTLASQPKSQRWTGDFHDLEISPKATEEIQKISNIPVKVEKTEPTIANTEAITKTKSPGPEGMSNLMPNPQNHEVSHDPNMLQLLHLGIDAGNVDLVKHLLNLGVDVNFESGGQTPLHQSIYKGNAEIARLLCEGGADMEGRGPGGYTPLQTAAKNGHTELAELFLEKGANIEAVDVSFKVSIPMDIVAARIKDPSLTRLLLGTGAADGASSGSGFTPLHYAACWGSEAVLKLLVQHGAHTEATDRVGCTPLMLATQAGSEGKVKQLVLHGANVNARNPSGFTSLTIAAREGQVDTARLLMEKGAYLEASNDLKHTPLMVAVNGGHTGVVNWLLDAGANINASDDQGFTPLIMAAKGGRETVVEVLLKAGAAIETMDASRKTALVHAVKRNHERVVAFLLQKGANPEAEDEHGETCLMLAMKNCSKAIMDLLTQHGAKKSWLYYRARMSLGY
ncbi:CAMK kinase [Fusarium coicis]|nr:CAMK kinase [Fusarium coicis]